MSANENEGEEYVRELLSTVKPPVQVDSGCVWLLIEDSQSSQSFTAGSQDQEHGYPHPELRPADPHDNSSKASGRPNVRANLPLHTGDEETRPSHNVCRTNAFDNHPGIMRNSISTSLRGPTPSEVDRSNLAHMSSGRTFTSQIRVQIELAPDTLPNPFTAPISSHQGGFQASVLERQAFETTSSIYSAAPSSALGSSVAALGKQEPDEDVYAMAWSLDECVSFRTSCAGICS